MVHKYKAKRIDNGEWIVGFAYELNGCTYILIENAADAHDHYRVDPSTLCISTGQKDCDGQEIFAGDILGGPSELEHHNRSWVATPFLPYARYRGVGNVTSLSEERIHFSQWKVRGNIIDNSNIL